MFHAQFCSEKGFCVRTGPLQIVRSILCANSGQYIPVLLSKIPFTPTRTRESYILMLWVDQINLSNPIRGGECTKSRNGRHKDTVWYTKPVSEVQYKNKINRLNSNVLLHSCRAFNTKAKVKTNPKPTIFSSKLRSSEVKTLRLYMTLQCYFYKSSFRIDLLYCWLLNSERRRYCKVLNSQLQNLENTHA